MPIDQPELQGTEKDGSRSVKYCLYCYEKGELLNPGMTLAQMTENVRTKLQEIKMPESFIAEAVKTLPKLERWSGRPVR